VTDGRPDEERITARPKPPADWPMWLASLDKMAACVLDIRLVDSHVRHSIERFTKYQEYAHISSLFVVPKVMTF
jgi:hypothetical protein